MPFLHEMRLKSESLNGKFGEGLLLSGKSRLIGLMSVMVVLKTPINIGILL